MMGYDFHMTGAGPRLIEINTNAGGALLNGLRTAALCNPRDLAGACSGLLSVEEIGERVVETFRAELRAVRGGDAVLRSVAIVDERPEEQFLYPEFELFRELLERSGIRAEIGDTAELVRTDSGGIELRGMPIDLVYLRDTDFALETPRTASLRAAYLAGEVVVTPSPREHHLLADKRRLMLFSSRESLLRLGVDSEDAAFLAEMVPETRLLGEMSFDEVWRTRKDWVFKPAASFGSRAVYRGDKISKRKLHEIHPEAHYLAQRRIEPGAVQIAAADGLADHEVRRAGLRLSRSAAAAGGPRLPGPGHQLPQPRRRLLGDLRAGGESRRKLRLARAGWIPGLGAGDLRAPLGRFLSPGDELRDRLQDPMDSPHQSWTALFCWSRL